MSDNNFARLTYNNDFIVKHFDLKNYIISEKIKFYKFLCETIEKLFKNDKYSSEELISGMVYCPGYHTGFTTFIAQEILEFKHIKSILAPFFQISSKEDLEIDVSLTRSKVLEEFSVLSKEEAKFVLADSADCCIIL